MRAMHQKVGIAADRRGEVRVLLERQTEVTDVRLLIDGLSERADHQSLEQRAVRPRGQALDQLAKFARARLLGKCRAHLQRIHHLLQLGHALLFGLAVHPVQAARLGETQRHRRLHVGGDHALLDQADAHRCASRRRTPRSCRCRRCAP